MKGHMHMIPGHVARRSATSLDARQRCVGPSSPGPEGYQGVAHKTRNHAVSDKVRLQCGGRSAGRPAVKERTMAWLWRAWECLADCRFQGVHTRDVRKSP